MLKKMSKLKFYISGGLVLLFFILGAALQSEHKAKLRERAEKKRWIKNYAEQTAYNKQNTEVIFKQNEFIGQLSDSTKSLLKRLQIAPRTVVKVVERWDRIHDTVDVPVMVSQIVIHSWKISDSAKCWRWEGIANLVDDSLKVKRTSFDYNNRQTDVFSRKLKFKFLFIRIYSKKEIIQQTVSECGESSSKTITVIK